MSSKVPQTTPQGAHPEDNFRDSPLEHIRTLYVAFIQGLFAASPVGAYHWSMDPDSELVVSDENPIKAESVGQRPAITITRGPMKFYTIGLGDLMDRDVRTDSRTKSVLVPGTMSVNCCSRVPLECDRLAWIVAEELWLHRELLMKEGFFEIGREPILGSPSPAGSLVQADLGDEWYATTVACPFQFVRTSKRTPLNQQVLQDITLSIRSRIAHLRRYGGAAASAGVDPPWEVTSTAPPPLFPDASDFYGNTPQPGALPPSLPTVPHPLNPAVRVVVRAARPNSPALKPPAMGGRPIPIQPGPVEESCEVQQDSQATDPRVVKV